jgi:hypothetical protein
MELQINTAYRTELAVDQGQYFNAGKLQVRSGTRPGANAAAAGTLLVAIDPLPDTAFSGIGTGGQTFKLGTWTATVVATGAPGHFRLISETDEFIQEGDAGATGAGTTMEIAGLVAGDLVEGGVLTVGSYTIAQGEGSPDPV